MFKGSRPRRRGHRADRREPRFLPAQGGTNTDFVQAGHGIRRKAGAGIRRTRGRGSQRPHALEQQKPRTRRRFSEVCDGKVDPEYVEKAKRWLKNLNPLTRLSEVPAPVLDHDPPLVGPFDEDPGLLAGRPLEKWQGGSCRRFWLCGGVFSRYKLRSVPETVRRAPPHPSPSDNSLMPLACGV